MEPLTIGFLIIAVPLLIFTGFLLALIVIPMKTSLGAFKSLRKNQEKGMAPAPTSEIKESLDSFKPVVLFFFRRDCSLCKQMLSLMDEIQEERDIPVIRIDASKEKGTSRLYSKLLGLPILNSPGAKLPVGFIIKNGKITSSFAGKIEKDRLLDKINRVFFS